MSRQIKSPNTIEIENNYFVLPRNDKIDLSKICYFDIRVYNKCILENDAFFQFKNLAELKISNQSLLNK